MPATKKPAKTRNAKALANTPAPQPEAKPAPAKPVADKDSLGCRVGSQSSQINAQLGAKPKSAAQLAEATGLPAARIRSHLLYLVGKQLAKATGDGYVLVKAK